MTDTLIRIRNTQSQPPRIRSPAYCLIRSDTVTLRRARKPQNPKKRTVTFICQLRLFVSYVYLSVTFIYKLRVIFVSFWFPCIYPYIYTHTQIYIFTNIPYIYIYTCIHIHIQYIHTRIRTCIIYVYIYVCVCVYIYIHTHTLAQSHTYIHIHKVTYTYGATAGRNARGRGAVRC